ncbi:Cdc6-related protein, AAA superfamily ATPase [Halogeometricum borinquense DSM 11551]|uniref:Cdc6-related protein, AAA superfamily ATPase n=2 Tax=Halogeometricum borinquense TaxID=60847 RepID=E4NW43_HALBP|nr:Cdc6/Cdc18 family protein [Halogeometricum borinquense]ADQ69263.1 Cdc6-related protein, AAA superfamily ATPase [Halogeometricum borinquense DSM 11551]ELY31561.1 Cdc6-related protein, AAA superfamily ATPase [Halogeometricum borinquense DSM 11551]RYJ08344.1 AAA family ATPase [Halogeometricum borinquense]
MIIREDVFDVDEFVPGDLRRRHRELNELSRALSCALDGYRPRNALLTGASGSGKTVTARYAVDQLQQEIATKSAYVDAWDARTTTRTLQRVLDQLGGATITARTPSRGDLLDAIRDAISHPTVLIVDEVEMLSDLGLLRDFASLDAGLVLIANDEDRLMANLDSHVSSRLAINTRVAFDSYSVTDLVSILEPRRRQGLVDGTVSDSVLEEIADRAGGNARHAIVSLREAALRAHQRGDERVTMTDIGPAVGDAADLIRQKASDRLGTHERLMLDIVRDHDSIAPRRVHELYEAECANRGFDPVTRRTTTTYLGKLEDYNLVESVGSTRNRKYQKIESFS